jgi:hypothetical protein
MIYSGNMEQILHFSYLGCDVSYTLIGIWLINCIILNMCGTVNGIKPGEKHT